MHRKTASKSSGNSSKNVYIDSEGNNGFLDVTYHYLPDRKDENSEPILKLKVPGDGNCGFYSIGLGIMNLIAQDKLVLPAATYQRFLDLLKSHAIQKIIRARAQYYKDGIPVHGKRVRIQKCAPEILNILKALNSGHLDNFDQFKQFLLQHQSYHKVLSLAICLAPALRALSINLFNQHYKPISHIQKIPAFDIYSRDGEDVTFGQLNLLSDFFGIHLNSYNKKHLPLGGSYGEFKPDETVQAFSHSNPVEEVKVEVDPLLLKPLESKAPSPKASPSALKKTEENRAPPVMNSENTKPVISLAYSGRPGHWDLLLSWSNYFSPPFYFGFDFSNVYFNSDYYKKREKHPTEIQAAPLRLALQKNRFQKFQHELTRLKIAVDALSDDQELRAGKKLVQILESNLNTLFIPKEASPSAHLSQYNAYVICSKTLNEAQPQFINKDRTISNILVNIGLFILGLGVGYIAIAGIHYYATGRIGFFHKDAALARNELPAVSRELDALYQEKVNPPTLTKADPPTPERLPDLPPLREWSKIRI